MRWCDPGTGQIEWIKKNLQIPNIINQQRESSKIILLSSFLNTEKQEALQILNDQQSAT